MNKQQRLNRLEKIKELIQQGKTYEEIGSRFNLKKNTICQIIKKYNLPKPSQFRKTKSQEHLDRLEASRGIAAEQYEGIPKPVRTRLGLMIQNARHRARAKRIVFNLRIGDLLPYPTVCPVLGITIDYAAKRTPAAPDTSASLDRLDNNKGYTKENVRIISYRANRLKSDSSIQELRAIVEYMEQNKKENEICAEL